MKPLHAMLLLIFGTFLCRPALAQQTVSIGSQRNPASDAAEQEETPAQQRIAAAKQQIASDPKKVQVYNELALAYLRRARETADLKYLKDADTALAQGLKLEPENFQLEKTQV